MNSDSLAYAELPMTADELISALLALAPSRRVQILDSGGARGADARCLIAGFDPCETIEARGDQLAIRGRGEKAMRRAHGAVLSLLDERLARHRAPAPSGPSLAPAGACIASFSYDLARTFLRLRSSKPAPGPNPEPSEPDASFTFHDTLISHDYARGVTRVASVAGERRVAETCAEIEAAARERWPRPDWAGAIGSPAAGQGAVANVAASNFTRGEYLFAVERVREHIRAGNIYQANLTQRFTCPLAVGDVPEQVFLRLRRDHPAAFAALLRRENDTVVSASPERFLRVEADGGDGSGRRVEAWPIKGTRPRGTSAAEDERLRAELLASEKDRAENTMIVDLLRNDLGRVCRYGSVKVAELCALQEHPTLFHLVSKVRGTLRDEVTAGELLRATFPCGSITGAPKLRAMEIIDEIEPAPRGLSMGAIGYFSFDGRVDLNVAIRTMIVRDGVARFNVGGGVVADSDPADEYDESLVKARALLRALGASE